MSVDFCTAPSDTPPRPHTRPLRLPRCLSQYFGAMPRYAGSKAASLATPSAAAAPSVSGSRRQRWRPPGARPPGRQPGERALLREVRKFSRSRCIGSLMSRPTAAITAATLTCPSCDSRQSCLCLRLPLLSTCRPASSSGGGYHAHHMIAASGPHSPSAPQSSGSMSRYSFAAY